MPNNSLLTLFFFFYLILNLVPFENSPFIEKNQNEQQLNMARHGSKTTLIQRIGQQSPVDKLGRKASAEQSLEETEQQASAAEEQRNQMLPSTNHQLNRISTNGNDDKLTARNGPTTNVLATGRDSIIGGLASLSGRALMISGISLLCLTLFISAFCFFRARAKQLLQQANDANGRANHHGSLMDAAMDSKQSLGASAQCTLGSISAGLLQQQSNLENGTINGLFTNNLNGLNGLNGLNMAGDHHAANFNNANSFIIAGTGALFAPQTLSSLDSNLDTYTAANLTIYSNQPSAINYAETNQNKL